MAAVGNSRFRRSKMPIAFQTWLPYAAGLGEDYSAYGLSRYCPVFFVSPPSLPGIGEPPRVICFWRRTQRDLAGSGYHQAADSLVGLPANPELETLTAGLSWAVDGALSPPPRPSAQFSAGSGQKSVLLLWLRPRRRSHPLRRTLPRRQIPRGDDVTSRLLPIGVSVIRCGPLLPGATASSCRSSGVLTATGNLPATSH